MLGKGAYDLAWEYKDAQNIMMSQVTAMKTWGGSNEMLLRWIRWRGWHWHTTLGGTNFCIFAVYKKTVGEDAADLSDGDEVQRMKDAGTLLYMRPVLLQGIDLQKPQWMEIELHDVKLTETQELVIGIQSMATVTANYSSRTIVEERILTVQ